MQWHYAVGGRQFGPVSKERLEEMVTEGEINRETLVWREGMPQWQRIDELMPERFAAVDGLPPLPGGAMMPAWEERQKLGVVPAAIMTVKQVLGEPSDTFTRLRHDGGFWEPLFYNVLLSTVASAISAGLSVILNITASGPNKLLELITKMNGTVSSSMKVSMNSGALGGGTVIGAMLFALIVTPIGVTIGTFVGSLISHLCLMILGSGKRGFETTFRVMSYSAGSIAPLSAIPLLGPLIGGLWCLVLYVIGFSKAHRMSTGRAIFAVALPILVCCGAIFLIVMVAFSAAGLAK